MSTHSLSTLRDHVAILEGNGGSVDVKDYAAKCCQLFGRIVSALTGNDASGGQSELQSETIHHGLLLVLKAYGTPEEDIELTSLAVGESAPNTVT